MSRSARTNSHWSIIASLLIALALILPLGGLVLAETPAVGPKSSHIDASQYLPRFDKANDGWDSILYVQNANPYTTNVTLIFRGTTDVQVTNELSPWSTWVVGADGVAGLPSSWTGPVLVQADNYVEALVYMTRSQGTLFAGYRGVAWGSYWQGRLGPLWNDGVRTSTLSVLNIARDEGEVPESIQARFHNFAGTAVVTQTLTVAPASGATFDTPSGGPYWAYVESPDTAFYGVVTTYDAAGTQVDVDATIPTTTDSLIPRALKGVDRGGGNRTTTLFVGNPNPTSQDLSLKYYNANGTVYATSPFTVPGEGATLLNLSDDANVPAGSTWAVGVSGGEGIQTGFGEQTVHTPTSTTHKAGAYGSPAAQLLGLPRLAKRIGEYSIISIQNVHASSTATISIKYYDLAGNLVHTAGTSLAARGWASWDLRDISQLGSNFQGSAYITSTGTNDPTVMVWVDGYQGGNLLYLPIVLRNSTTQ